MRVTAKFFKFRENRYHKWWEFVGQVNFLHYKMNMNLLARAYRMAPLKCQMAERVELEY